MLNLYHDVREFCLFTGIPKFDERERVMYNSKEAQRTFRVKVSYSQ